MMLIIFSYFSTILVQYRIELKNVEGGVWTHALSE